MAALMISLKFCHDSGAPTYEVEPLIVTLALCFDEAAPPADAASISARSSVTIGGFKSVFRCALFIVPRVPCCYSGSVSARGRPARLRASADARRGLPPVAAFSSRP